MTERRDFRQTKIICTLGPSSDSVDTIRDLATAGMNVARLNMSHGDHDSHLRTIRHIHDLRHELNHPVAVLLDLQGPAIRTGERRGNLELAVGEARKPAAGEALAHPDVARGLLRLGGAGRQFPVAVGHDGTG